MDRTVCSVFFRQGVLRQDWVNHPGWFDPSEIDEVATAARVTSAPCSVAPAGTSGSLCPPTLSAVDRREWQRTHVRDALVGVKQVPFSANRRIPNSTAYGRTTPLKPLAGPNKRVLRLLQGFEPMEDSVMRPCDRTYYQPEATSRSTAYFSSFCSHHLPSLGRPPQVRHLE